jgi:hypothetical protein
MSNAHANGQFLFNSGSRTRVLLSLFAVIALAVNGFAQSYEIEGRMTHSCFALSGKVTSESHYNFKVSVRDNHWLVHQQLVDGAEGPDWTEIAGDGTNTYTVDHFPTSPRADKLESNFGRVRPCPFPEHALLPGRQLWFSFASSAYLDQIQDNLMPRLSDLQMENLSKVKVAFEREPRPPRLPIKAEFRAPGHVTFYSAGNQTELVDYPPPYNTNYISPIYVVKGATNFGELVLPRS